MYMNSFPRIEAIKMLLEKSAERSRAVEIIEHSDFYGTEREVHEYKNHLKRNTYVLCARGSENYSFRLYETLSFGRVPVILDTDMELPKEINWERLSVIVPYNAMAGIYDAVLRDYESRSADDFLRRQREAFSTMTELRKMRWVGKLANEIAATMGVK